VIAGQENQCREEQSHSKTMLCLQCSFAHYQKYLTGAVI